MADANSCCCGATKSKPCACMKKMAKTGGKMQCSSKEPMCACYKEQSKIKKAFRTGWSLIKESRPCPNCPMGSISPADERHPKCNCKGCPDCCECE